MIEAREPGHEPRVVGDIEEEARVEHEQQSEGEERQDRQHDRGHPAFAGQRPHLHHHRVPLADHLRQVLEDFGEIAAGLVLHRQRHDEHPHVVEIPPLGHALKRVAKLRAIGDLVDGEAELRCRSDRASRPSAGRARRRSGGRREGRGRTRRARPGTAPRIFLRVRVALKLSEHQRKRGAERSGESRARSAAGRR